MESGTWTAAWSSTWCISSSPPSATLWFVGEGNWHLLRTYWMPGSFCVVSQCDSVTFWLCVPGRVTLPPWILIFLHVKGREKFVSQVSFYLKESETQIKEGHWWVHIISKSREWFQEWLYPAAQLVSSETCLCLLAWSPSTLAVFLGRFFPEGQKLLSGPYRWISCQLSSLWWNYFPIISEAIPERNLISQFESGPHC